jgi:hypothetical protein
MMDGLLIRRGYAGRAVLLRILALKMRLSVVLSLLLIAWVAFHTCANTQRWFASIRGTATGRHWAFDLNRGGAILRLAWSTERVRKEGPNGVRGAVEALEWGDLLLDLG